jgi:quercetin dioxygenase-like cupin family protein
MKFLSTILALGFIGLVSVPSLAAAEDAPMMAPSDIHWGPAPNVLPAGAQAALLFGDPTKEGLFALRLKLPAGYAIAPHTHPGYEVVTVISGSTKLGMGETADRSAVKEWPAGSFYALPPGMAHFVYVDEETVLQVTTNGPWGLTYINPKDDPRKTQ